MDLIERYKISLNQTELDVSNSNYVIHEHCSELRRQVQLSKDTKIEELSDQFIQQIDDYEKQNIDATIIKEKIKWYKEPNSFSKFANKEIGINYNIFGNKKLLYKY